MTKSNFNKLIHGEILNMPYHYCYRGVNQRLTPKQLKSKMDKAAKRESEKIRLIKK